MWFKTLPHLSMLFVALLLTSNVIGPVPLVFGSFIIPAGLFIFPLTYVLGDVLAESYGFKAARQVITVGLGCNLLMAFICYLVVLLPTLNSWSYQEAYHTVLHYSTRLMVVSAIAYFLGDWVNAWVITRLNRQFAGRFFKLRAFLASAIGAFLETGLFMVFAFYGTMPNEALLRLFIFYYGFKLSYMFVLLPLTAFLVRSSKPVLERGF